MQILEVGKPLGDTRYSVNEGMRIRFNSAGLDLIACARGLTKAEKDSWTKGSITVSLFGSGRPDVIFAVKTGVFSFDCPANFQKIPATDQGAWIDTPFNLITMILVEQRGGIIAGLRAIGLNHDFADGIRAACLNQLQFTSTQIDVSFSHLTLKLTTDQIIEQSKFKHTFRP